MSYIMGGLFKFYMRIRTAGMRKHERKRLRILKTTTDAIIEMYETTNESGISIPPHLEKLLPFKAAETKEMHSIGLFILTIEHDVSSLSYMILMEAEKWNRQNLSRQLSVTLYECTEDLPEIFGNHFREFLRKLPNSNELLQELNSIIKLIHEFKKKHKSLSSWRESSDSCLLTACLPTSINY